MSTQLKALNLRAAERPVSCVKFNADGDLLFTSGKDGLICVWSTKTGQRLGTFHYLQDDPHNITPQRLIEQSSQAACQWLDVTLDSKQLVVAMFDTILFFNALTGDFLDCIEAPARIDCVEFNRKPGNQTSIVCCHTDKGAREFANPAFRVYHSTEGRGSQSGRRWNEGLVVENIEGMPTCCAWGPYDETIIGATDTGKIMQWNLEGDVVSQVTAHKGVVKSLAFNNNRTVMLSVSLDHTAALWELPFMNGGQGLISRYTSDRPLSAGAISPLFDLPEDDVKMKPHMLIAGGQEASEVTTTAASSGQFEGLLINMKFGREIARVHTHYSPVSCVAFSPDGTAFATGAIEGNVIIYKFDDSFMTLDHRS
eukprot:Blabericola_migrator_1__4835@NODE_2538_length_2633_cov_265_940374_g1588_i0_p2_GENE_NODE_2538_length_2633_cov_265_940374_g1588_i0NODE_2538_length_2633_cov_265_940374_g1588_i0_p2_ORF_typecomplete_len368_score69_62ANAPC4_WD40/PF12894_7/2_3e06ANAPC4_WD40/PF12894_7/3_3ANAPC4_WD40/PF12894_7/0_00011ANAPC4_WD40/PF12894_7/3e05WD40/PF00400_32/5_1e07WD40/PF00400_32/1e02WD40/PF00400_32/0_021WD40/PF00400_32/2_8e05Ge1_WD40/PF16529_5/0_12Ge1_WD40/PF16529_5/8_7Ge1_WD40/PF16529_5/0_00011WD40_like/PF17005_5/0_069